MANKHIGPSVDSWMAEEGWLEHAQTQAIKEVIAWQLQEAMKEQKLTKTQLAQRMHTSRAQVNRILDPNDDGVSLATIQRAATVIGRKVHLALV